jgi:iron(III) transport system substrate-binding protein
MGFKKIIRSCAAGILLIGVAVARGKATAEMTLREAIKSIEHLPRQERQQMLIAQARKEGRILWSSSTPAESVEPVARGFREKYPGIQLEHFFVSGRVLADRVIREYKAGKHDIDILGTSAVTFLGIKEAGVIDSYSSPETEGIKPALKDSAGFWTSKYANMLAVVCNKNLVKMAPTSWREFTDPKWKRNFSIDTERFQWFLAFRRLYGDEEAKKLISAYMRNGALVRRSGQLQIQLVAGGEFACALAVYFNDLVNAMRKGAPIIYSVPEPLLLSPNLVMMTRLPPHPFGAMLLYDYVVSAEGVAQLTRNVPLLPSREGTPVTEEVMPLQKKPYYFISVEDQSRNYNETRQMYLSLLQ